MSLKGFFSLMWFTTFEVMNIAIDFFGYKFTFLSLAIFGTVVLLLLRFLFMFGKKE